jgi:rod shape-determining protein MreB and related proteins
MTMRIRPRRSSNDAIAVDLGTARTQVFVPGRGMVLDEPTLAAYGEGGEVVAAGHDAWVASVVGPARLRMPVRGGVVRDPVGCVHLLRLLLRKAGLVNVDGGDVAVALPATAEPADESVLAAVIESATGGRAVPVESSLAALLATGADMVDGGPRIVCDLGAGVSEVTAVGDGRVLAAAVRRLGVRSFDDDPARTIHRLTRSFCEVLDSLAPQVAADAVARPMLVVGGGALRSDLLARLSESFSMALHVPAHPRELVARGLARCLTVPRVAA